jgi:hypothetical protein
MLDHAYISSWHFVALRNFNVRYQIDDVPKNKLLHTLPFEIQKQDGNLRRLPMRRCSRGEQPLPGPPSPKNISKKIVQIAELSSWELNPGLLRLLE